MHFVGLDDDFCPICMFFRIIVSQKLTPPVNISIKCWFIYALAQDRDITDLLQMVKVNSSCLGTVFETLQGLAGYPEDLCCLLQKMLKNNPEERSSTKWVWNTETWWAVQVWIMAFLCLHGVCILCSCWCEFSPGATTIQKHISWLPTTLTLLYHHDRGIRLYTA